LIKIETICEDNKNNDNKSSNNNETDYHVRSSEQVQITKEKRKTDPKTISAKINRSVPETCRIVLEITLNKGVESIPTDTIKVLKENTQKLTEDKVSEKKAHVHKVTENTVHVQKTTDTIEIPIVDNNETKNEKKIDPQLLLSNKTGITAAEFTNIIREYNTYEQLPIDEIGAYIINRVEC
jgi:hypothetical protein